MELNDWAPDQPEANTQTLTVAQGVIPIVQGFRSQRALSDYSANTLDERPRGSYTVNDETGIPRSYSGDRMDLYELIDRVLTKRSRSGGYDLGDKEKWEFGYLLGNVYATAKNQLFQGKNANNASDLYEDFITSTNKPQGRHMAIVRNQVMMGNIFWPDDPSSNFDYPNMVWWCALGNPRNWDPDIRVLSGRQDLAGEGGGEVMKLVGGEYVTVFRRNSVWRGDFVGPATIYEFREVEPARGCLASGSVVSVGRIHYYLSDDGIFVNDGQNSQPVGAGKINRHLLNNLDSSHLDRITAIRDPDDTVIYWLYPGPGNSGGRPNRLLALNWLYNKWSETSLETVEELAYAAPDATTLDGLDALFASIDDVTPSLDSDVWKGGEQQFGAFSETFRLGFFQGPALQALLETADFFQDAPGRTRIDRFRPIVEAEAGSGAGAASLQIGTRENLTDDIQWGSVIPVNSFGEFRQRRSGRYMRLRLLYDGAAKALTGVEAVDPKRAGRR